MVTSTRTVKLARPKFERAIHVSDSDLVDLIQYDTETQVLDATLKSGQRYRYREVAPVTFAHVVTAKSVGQAFNTYIRNRAYTKLPKTRNW